MTEIGPHPSGPGWVDRTDEEQIEALNSRVVEVTRQRDGLMALLEELHAVVIGECPSLLNEDSGGDAGLDHRIRELIAKTRGGSANE